MDRESFKKQAQDLSAEVTAKSEAFGKGEITSAEFKEYMDKAETHSAEIACGAKNYDRALAFRAGNDMSDGDGRPVEQRAEVDPRLKKVNDTYADMKAAAANRTRGSFSFDLGLKTQGATGLMGEAASGTTAPAALAGGSYFLGGTAGSIVAPEFIPGVVDLRFYPNVIASLFPSMPVSSPVVSYVREGTWTNNAAAVPEGATKPTSTNTLTRLTEQVGKIANLVHVTDELMQDAPAFWSLIQQRLAQGVTRKEEVELLAGSGYPGVNGLLNRTTGFTKPAVQTAVANLVIPGASTPGSGAGADTVVSVTPGAAIQGTGTTGTAPTGSQIAVGILTSLTSLRVNTFFEPDTILMNPADWQTIRTATDTQGQFLGGSFFGTNYGQGANVPSSGATEEGLTLWGKRVVTTPVLPQGYVLVGAFSDAAMVLRKDGLRVEFTNTNGTDFEQNLWTGRAEERVGLLVERPELFVLIQLQNKP